MQASCWLALPKLFPIPLVTFKFWTIMFGFKKKIIPPPITHQPKKKRSNLTKLGGCCVWLPAMPRASHHFASLGHACAPSAWMKVQIKWGGMGCTYVDTSKYMCIIYIYMLYVKLDIYIYNYIICKYIERERENINTWHICWRFYGYVIFGVWVSVYVYL